MNLESLPRARKDAMNPSPRTPNVQDRNRRRAEARWLVVLLAGSLVMLLIVALAGRAVWAGLAPAPTPTLGRMPTPTVISGVAVVQQIQRLSRLETNSYSVQTVVTAERPGGFLGIGQQKVLVIVRGTVVAGIDLSKLGPQDVKVSPDGKRVKVKLPDVEILSRYLDEGATQLYDHQTGLFTKPDSSLVLEAQQMGMSRVMQAACEGGIMKRATEDGQRAMRDFLRIMGFDTVEFDASSVPPCPEDI